MTTIEVEVWGADGETLMAKGHHDPAQFFEAALTVHRRYYGGKDSEDFAEAFDAGDVRQTWWKPDPKGAAAYGSPGEEWYQAAKPEDEDAFPVTVIQEG